jgi:hypothetical protein
MWVPLVKPDLFKHLDNFLGVDGATSIFVKNQEDVSEVFVVLGSDSISPCGGDFLFGFGVVGGCFVGGFGVGGWGNSSGGSHLK